MNKWLLWGFRIILAGVFIYAGFVKILDPAGFANSIDNYRLLPWFLTSLLAAVLPWVEVMCGIYLLWGKWLSGSSFILMVLNGVFMIAIASAIARGLDIDCGCFSLTDSGTHVSLLRIIEDGVLLGMSLAVYIWSLKPNTTD